MMYGFVLTPERSHYLRGHRNAEADIKAKTAVPLREAKSKASMDSFTGLYWWGYVDELEGRADWLSSK